MVSAAATHVNSVMTVFIAATASGGGLIVFVWGVRTVEPPKTAPLWAPLVGTRGVNEDRPGVPKTGSSSKVKKRSKCDSLVDARSGRQREVDEVTPQPIPFAFNGLRLLRLQTGKTMAKTCGLPTE